MENDLTEDDAAPEVPISNSERLLKHLEKDALSTRLVQAHGNSGGEVSVLKEVIAERLEQVRQGLVSEN